MSEIRLRSSWARVYLPWCMLEQPKESGGFRGRHRAEGLANPLRIYFLYGLWGAVGILQIVFSELRTK